MQVKVHVVMSLLLLLTESMPGNETVNYYYHQNQNGTQATLGQLQILDEPAVE